MRFSTESFERALRYCRDNPNFYVKIFFDNRRKIQLFNGVIRDEVENGGIPHVRNLRYSNSSLHIYFDNGSDISVETYNPSTRYFGAHYLIVDFDDEIDPFLETFLRGRINTYRQNYRFDSAINYIDGIPTVDEIFKNDDSVIRYEYKVARSNKDRAATDKELEAFLFGDAV